MYNPLSVIGALLTNKFRPYWTVTGTYGDIDELIGRDFDGLNKKKMPKSAQSSPYRKANFHHDMQYLM